MKTYKVLLDTKFVGRHTETLEAKNFEEAKKKASRWENPYNKVLKITEVRRTEV